jgi:hypothetical protein
MAPHITTLDDISDSWVCRRYHIDMRGNVFWAGETRVRLLNTSSKNAQDFRMKVTSEHPHRLRGATLSGHSKVIPDSIHVASSKGNKWSAWAPCPARRRSDRRSNEGQKRRTPGHISGALEPSLQSQSYISRNALGPNKIVDKFGACREPCT